MLLSGHRIVYVTRKNSLRYTSRYIYNNTLFITKSIIV